MRLDWLRIPAYRGKRLRNFEIDFDENQSTTILIGRNGSGKSNLIEAIVEIFRDLELSKPPAFAYELQYVCRDKVININADPERSNRRLDIQVDGKSITQTTFNRKLVEYLPNFVFAYYSGLSSRLEKHFDEPTRRYYQEILNSKQSEMPLRRMFFCRKEYSQLVLLAFFLSNTETAHELLEKYLNIKCFDSALFVLKTPWWRGTGRPNKTQLAEGDPRFWYARGAFKTFLDRLWSQALAPIRNTEAVERDVRGKTENTERLYLFIKNQEELTDLKTEEEDEKTLFGYLESLFLCDLIDEVRVTVERTDGTRVKFTQLSEGEQQLLTVLGLMLFTQNDESIYLLDEPDTHLNPVWTYEYLKLLQDNIRAEKGQLLVATHNPLMIGSLYKNQVRIISQQEESTIAEEPEYDPIGIGVEGLLKSELYGLRSTLAPEILDKLDRHYQLLGKQDKTPEENLVLINLANELNSLHVSRTHPNPYFEHFATAMANTITEKENVLSKEEIEAQARLADEILSELSSESTSNENIQR
ncbi:AAA family ATPase [Nodosilinea sp. E11]|uniref:AAA family ATPase n=1 Tax=Nodosilinea sp. E11 TaxID=3037479 RepID=UPI0029349046|nr:AAA family ATPase [Nodosilinea sp. E11]WOD41909.1 AAA family ATPase [Nodosilinea sp. E11]